MNNENLPMEAPDQSMVESNPFAGLEPSDPNVSDAPIVSTGGFMDLVVNDSNVPKNIKAKFWEIFTPDIPFGFQDTKTKMDKMMNMEVMRIDELCSKPYLSYSFQDEYIHDKMKNVLEFKLDRAVGKGDKNERILVQSQITENRQIMESDRSKQGGGGFMRNLVSRR